MVLAGRLTIQTSPISPRSRPPTASSSHRAVYSDATTKPLAGFSGFAQVRGGAMAGAAATATRVASATFIRSKAMYGATPAAMALAGEKPDTTASQVVP